MLKVQHAFQFKRESSLSAKMLWRDYMPEVLPLEISGMKLNGPRKLGVSVNLRDLTIKDLPLFL